MECSDTAAQVNRTSEADRSGLTLLHCAATSGSVQVRSALPTASPLRPCANESRCSPPVPLLACLFVYLRVLGRLQAVEILLSLSACVNASDARKGISALHCAADRGVPSVVDLLLNFQADVNK